MTILGAFKVYELGSWRRLEKWVRLSLRIPDCARVYGIQASRSLLNTTNFIPSPTFKICPSCDEVTLFTLISTGSSQITACNESVQRPTFTRQQFTIDKFNTGWRNFRPFSISWCSRIISTEVHPPICDLFVRGYLCRLPCNFCQR